MCRNGLTLIRGAASFSPAAMLTKPPRCVSADRQSLQKSRMIDDIHNCDWT